MKRIGILFVISLLDVAGRAQGIGGNPSYPAVDFVTYYTPLGIDAPVTYLNGQRVGPEFTGQLWGGAAGTPVSSLEPLLPTAKFSYFPDQPQYNGYIFASGVKVPNLNGSPEATIVMRAYNGSSWDTSLYRGESLPITVQFSNPSGPDPFLQGLLGFNVELVPEPSGLTVFSIGGLLLGLAAIKNQKLPAQEVKR